MSLMDSDISTGAGELVKLIDSGHGGEAANRLRSDALEMNPQDFLNLIKKIQEIDPKVAGKELQWIENGDGRKSLVINDVPGDDGGLIASFKDGKTVGNFLEVLPDQRRGSVVEQSDLSPLPKLSDAQNKILHNLEDAISSHDPNKIKDLLVSFRGKPKELDPIMQCLAADLDKQGISMLYTEGGLLAGSDTDSADTAYLKLWNKEGGPVVEITGHKDFRPYIGMDEHPDKDGTPMFKDRPAHYLLNKPSTMPDEVQAAFQSFSQKMHPELLLKRKALGL